MAGVNFVISAITQKYINDINKAKTQGDKSFDAMGKKAQSFSSGVTDAFNSPAGAINGFLGRLGPAGLAIGAVGAASVGLGIKLANMGAQVSVTQKQLESLAKTNNMSTESMNKYAIAVSTTGIDMEKFGDILKDVADKQGDFLSTGGGGMADYFDVIHGKINRTADDFRGLSSIETLKIIQKDLDDVGASTAQQTFVMEALASDASKLSGILRMSESEMDNMLKSYAVNRASITKQVSDDIAATQNNMDMLQNNFNAALTNSFRGLISLANQMTKTASDALYEISEGAVTQNVVKDYLGGKMEINIGNADDFLKNAQSIQEQMRVDSRARAQSELPMYGLGNKKKEDELTAKYIDEGNQRLKEDTIKAADLKNAASINTDGKGTTGNAPSVAVTSYKEANERLKELSTQRTNILSEQGRLETQLQTAIGENTKQALTSQIEVQKSALEKNATDTKAAQEQLGVYQKQASDKALAESRKAAQRRTEAIQNTLKTENDIEEFAYQQKLEKLQEYLSEGALTQGEYQIAIELAEENHQQRLVDIQQRAINEKKKLLDKEYQDRLAAMNLIKDFSTDVEQQANQELLIKRTQVEQAFELDQQKGEGAVLSEQDKNNKLAEIDREYEAQKKERELEDMYNREEAAVLQAESEREFIQEQYANKVIDKQEYDRLMIESDKAVGVASRDLAMSRIQSMSMMFAEAGKYAKEGSKNAKIMFAMEKSSTIASMSLSMYEQWGKAKTWGDKAKVMAEYIPQIATATAITLGKVRTSP